MMILLLKSGIKYNCAYTYIFLANVLTIDIKLFFVSQISMLFNTRKIIQKRVNRETLA